MSYYAEERYDVYDERHVRARKAHRCGACREPIAPGARYWRIGIVFDGSASTVLRCERCQAIHVHLRSLGDCDTWPAERLDCGQSYVSEWECDPPPRMMRPVAKRSRRRSALSLGPPRSQPPCTISMH